MMINQPQCNTDLDNEQLMEVEAQYWVDMKEALVRLETGKAKPDDFKKVILDGYFKDRAINAVSMLSHDYTRQTGTRGELMEELNAISALQIYFLTIKNLGTVSPDEEQNDEE